MKRSLLLLTLAACRSAGTDPTTAAPAPQTSATPDASALAAPDASLAAVEVAPPPDVPGAWRSRPPAKADLYVQLDGICRYLAVRQTGGDAFALTTDVPYIGEPNVTTLAHMSATGLDDLSTGTGMVIDILGHYPDALLLREWGGERIYIGGHVKRWSGTAWKPLFENPHDANDKALRRDFESPTPWKKGYVAVSDWAKPDANSIGGGKPSDFGTDLATVDVPQADVKPLLKSGWKPLRVLGLRSGELFAVGEQGDVQVVRWLDASGAVHEYAHPKGQPGRLDLAGERIEELRITSNGRTIARLDGATFVAATDPPPPPPVPGPEGAQVVMPWAYTKKGLVWRHDGSGWVKQTLPPPAFGTSTARSISSFVVVPSGEAAFVVGYQEKGRGWRTPVQYHALVRSQRPAETFRCNEPDPENLEVSSGSGYTSWPPLADETCTTPFVVLSRRSKANPPPQKDWPTIRSAMKGNEALGATIELVEVEAGGRTYLGTSTKTLAEALLLLDTVAKATPIRGEIVCARPTPTISFTVDVATGKSL